MVKDVCIKAGSFCPIHRGKGGVDCWHEAREFHAGSDYLEKIIRAQDRIKQLEAATPHHGGDAVDAARYRWLREHFRFANDSLRELWFDPSLEPNDSGVPADLDQEIDAAIAADKDPK